MVVLALTAILAGAFFTFQKLQSRAAFQAAAGEKSIAVLPFENLSAGQENAYFADGIQDDILTSLAKISDLKVISRTSVSHYRGVGAARNLRVVARELGVENVLEGSVRREGNRVLVNVQLIDARNDRHIWAERYDRTVADVIGLQGELAAQIAAVLKSKLAPEEKARLEAKPTGSSDAYVLYLKALGREKAVNHSTEDAIAAERLYEQAIALDPRFALAQARLSIVNSNLANGPTDNRVLRRRLAPRPTRRCACRRPRRSPYGPRPFLLFGGKDDAAASRSFPSPRPPRLTKPTSFITWPGFIAGRAAGANRSQVINARKISTLATPKSSCEPATIILWCATGRARPRVTVARWRLRQIRPRPGLVLLTSKCFKMAILLRGERFWRRILQASTPTDW